MSFVVRLLLKPAADGARRDGRVLNLLELPFVQTFISALRGNEATQNFMVMLMNRKAVSGNPISIVLFCKLKLPGKVLNQLHRHILCLRDLLYQWRSHRE